MKFVKIRNLKIRWAKGHKETLRKEIAKAFDLNNDALLKHWLIPAIQTNVWDPIANDNQAILYAADSGHLEVVRFLATIPGVDTATTNNQPIIWAASRGRLEVVRFLASLPGVDPAAQDNLAIRWAASEGHLETVRFLLSLDRVRQTLDRDRLQEYQRIIDEY